MQTFLFSSKLAIIFGEEFWLEFRNIYEVFREGQHIDNYFINKSKSNC